ncbi:MAG TPA: class I SAM-dependent methyltransferase [Burkholderiales bacterium]|nr:class I SAM-dependent methyltransferase [Burkholderiales bacterium]
MPSKSKPGLKREKQYLEKAQNVEERGNQRLGIMTSWAYWEDPKRLAFTFARYKFVAKMLSGCRHVLEVGCGDGFVSRVVAQEVGALTAIDFDQGFIDDANSRSSADDPWRITFKQHDMLENPVAGEFDGIFSLDVLEHIQPDREHVFLKNMIAPLTARGTVIIGMPSLQSQQYASPQSKQGHVNCKDQQEFRKLMLGHFHNVYMFSMNDEVVHTGYGAMSHYNIALCCGKIK